MRLVLIISLATFIGCNTPNSIKNWQVSETSNPLVVEARYQLGEEEEIALELTVLSSGEKFYCSKTQLDTAGSFSLPFLPPGEDIQIRLLGSRGLDLVVDTIHSNSAPRNIADVHITKNDPMSFDGYLLTQRRLVNGSIYALNNRGQVIWFQRIDGQPKLANWNSDSTITVLYGPGHMKNSAGDKITRYHLNGEAEYHLDLSELSEPLVAHHEVLDVEDSIMVLVYETREFEVGGEKVSVTSDAIYKMDRQGKIGWKWSLFDVFNPMEDDDLLEHLDDWGHTNAFFLDEDGHVLVSLRDWNSIVKINTQTGKMIWKLDGSESEVPFSGQHAIHRSADGRYLMFNNGRDERQSSIYSFRVEDTVPYELESKRVGEDYYAERMGNVLLLPNGHFLACIPRSRSIAVFDYEANPLTHYTVGLPDPYRVEFIPSFYLKTSPFHR